MVDCSLVEGITHGTPQKYTTFSSTKGVSELIFLIGMLIALPTSANRKTSVPLTALKPRR